MATCKDCFHYGLCDGVFYSQGAEGCASWADNKNIAEVVRCKDCKHWSMGYCNHFAYYSYEPMTNEDDFCSYGERKDNG